MEFGGPRSLNPIRKLFVLLWRILSMLTRVLEALSRVERATAPPGPTGINHDAWLGLRPDSAEAYQQAVREFLSWCHHRRLPLEYPTEVDRAVVLYSQQVRLSRGKMETLTSALKRGMPSLKGQLYWAEAHQRNLLRYQPPEHKTPMMRFVCIAVGHRMAMSGWARAGALLVLQGCTGLRPGELLNLGREDIVPGRRGVNNGNGVIALGRRVGTKAGRAQFVVVHAAEGPTALTILSAFAATTKPGQKLSGLNYQRFRSLLDRTLKDMGLADLKYTPHSPRAGWATTLRLAGVPFTEIQERGRWSSAASLRIYLDAVAASTTLLQKTQTLHAFATYMDENFAERFPWWR